MPVSTLSAAVNITPVVVKTLYRHSKRKRHLLREYIKEEHARDDLLFDEAFNIVKAFILLTTKNTVESLQAFTNTHVPAPPWGAVCPVRIPLNSCNRAADILIEWFGPEELNQVVGGERWWQVRGLDGVDGEWITEKEQLTDQNLHVDSGENLSELQKEIKKMEQLESVMLYIHGGGYFWGSINTHRYQILRYARKIRGRAFAVNYRKAPQYPWPCPLQDVLAAYLYLIEPPLEAVHKAVPPSRIVFAGDSAGGGLCVTVLTTLRDMGLPLPAGAVLISPWVDLTHSFPSIMTNTESDIIPPHGFVNKHSVLWPIEPIKEGGRVRKGEINSLPKPSHAASPSFGLETEGSLPDIDNVDLWEPKPLKVLMKNPDAIPLEVRSQIQHYATTEQLTHPLVSPILQGSLGNLCPLYILAGDSEVLRDEVMYLAHRAAHPSEYPVRKDVLRDGWRQKENAQKFTIPTKVHLQVFDEMCHVLTVFIFTPSAKYAYRSIAEFVKHVTQQPPEHLENNPFPELHRPPLGIFSHDHGEVEKQTTCVSVNKDSIAQGMVSMHSTRPDDNSPHKNKSDVQLYKENEDEVEDRVKGKMTDKMPDLSHSDKPAHDIPSVLMVRERVDINGRVRVMEAKEEIPTLWMKPAEIGIIKEEPLLRWSEGQEEWDRRFRKTAEKVVKKRAKYRAKAQWMIEHAREQGLVIDGEDGYSRTKNSRRDSLATNASSRTTRGMIQADRRWGPLDLELEKPPPTAIARRRDTPEGLALIKKSIYHTAPVTHKYIPRMKICDAIKAAFDPNDDPYRPPDQSASEQQVHTGIMPHGLRIWESLVSYFMRKSSMKAADGARAVGHIIGAGSPDSK